MGVSEEVIIRVRIKDSVFEKKILVDLGEVIKIGEALDILYQYKIINAWEMKEDKETSYLFYPRGEVKVILERDRHD